MGRIALLALAGFGAVVGVAAGVLAAGLRWRIPIVLDGIRRLNRRVINPRNLRTAGQPGSPWAVVHHVGRRTGTAYRTPVGAHPRGDGFVVVLPYGPTADWVRNVLAAGTAELERAGARHVLRPRTVARQEVAADLPPADRRMTAALGLDTLLVLEPA